MKPGYFKHLDRLYVKLPETCLEKLVKLIQVNLFLAVLSYLEPLCGVPSTQSCSLFFCLCTLLLAILHQHELLRFYLPPPIGIMRSSIGQPGGAGRAAHCGGRFGNEQTDRGSSSGGSSKSTLWPTLIFLNAIAYHLPLSWADRVQTVYSKTCYISMET